MKDWNSQQYEDFGFQIGTILVQLLEKLENVDAVIYDQSAVVQVFDGVLDGIADASGVRAEDVKACIRSASEVVIDFEEAVRLLETGKAGNVIEALQKFGEGLEELPDAINDCEKPTVEVINLARKLTAMIASMRSPQSFAFHIGKDLIVNGKDIYHEVNREAKLGVHGCRRLEGWQLARLRVPAGQGDVPDLRRIGCSAVKIEIINHKVYLFIIFFK